MTDHISDQKPQRLPTDYHDLVSTASGYKLLAEARQAALEAALAEIATMRGVIATLTAQLTAERNRITRARDAMTATTANWNDPFLFTAYEFLNGEAK